MESRDCETFTSRTGFQLYALSSNNNLSLQDWTQALLLLSSPGTGLELQ